MTWTNAFDAGACNVDVHQGNTLIFSGALAKGETSIEFNNGLSRTFTVSVSSMGVVKLNQITGVTTNTDMAISVAPQYALADPSSLRISGISMPDGVNGSASAFSDSVALTTADAGATWTPDPATFMGTPAPLGAWDVYMGLVA